MSLQAQTEKATEMRLKLFRECAAALVKQPNKGRSIRIRLSSIDKYLMQYYIQVSINKDGSVVIDDCLNHYMFERKISRFYRINKTIITENSKDAFKEFGISWG